MTKFSDFVRHATPEEKQRVYEQVLKQASESQKKVIEEVIRLEKLNFYDDPIHH